MVTLVKRDGSKEPYEENKIARVAESAGLDKERSLLLAQAITAWLTENKTEELTSLAIRDKVIEEIQKIDESAANTYMWYEKTKDVPQ